MRDDGKFTYNEWHLAMRNWTREIFFCLILSLFSVICHAQGVTNRDLGEGCRQAIDFLEYKGPSRPFGMACLGYLEGVRDALIVDNGQNYLACPPPSATNEQLIRVYLRWVQANPDKLHENRYLGVINAFTESFHCP